jgi:hypothetical protein
LNGNADGCAQFHSMPRTAPPPPAARGQQPAITAPNPSAIAPAEGFPTDPRNAAAAIGFRLDGRVQRMNNATVHYGSLPASTGQGEYSGVIIDRHDSRSPDDRFYVVISTGGQAEKFDDARAMCVGIGRGFDLPLFSRRFQLMGVPNFSTPVGELRDPRGVRNQMHALWLRIDNEAETRSELRGSAKSFLVTMPMNYGNTLLGRVNELSTLGQGGITFIDGLLIATQGGRAQEDRVIEATIVIRNNRRQAMPINLDLYFNYEGNAEEAIAENPNFTEEQKKTIRDAMAAVGNFMRRYPNHANQIRAIFRANTGNRDARHAAMNRYIDRSMAQVWYEIFNGTTAWMLAASASYPQMQSLMRIIQQPNSGQPRLYCAREIAKQ